MFRYVGKCYIEDATSLNMQHPIYKLLVTKCLMRFLNLWLLFIYILGSISADYSKEAKEEHFQLEDSEVSLGMITSLIAQVMKGVDRCIQTPIGFEVSYS